VSAPTCPVCLRPLWMPDATGDMCEGSKYDTCAQYAAARYAPEKERADRLAAAMRGIRATCAATDGPCPGESCPGWIAGEALQGHAVGCERSRADRLEADARITGACIAIGNIGLAVAAGWLAAISGYVPAFALTEGGWAAREALLGCLDGYDREYADVTPRLETADRARADRLEAALREVGCLTLYGDTGGWLGSIYDEKLGHRRSRTCVDGPGPGANDYDEGHTLASEVPCAVCRALYPEETT
jgi:hypothetical protein